MSEANRGSGTGIVMAALFGVVVGAGVALLFAPCSGRETREWLARKTRDAKDRTTSALEHVKEATRQAAREIRRGAGESAIAHDRPVDTEAGDTSVRG